MRYRIAVGFLFLLFNLVPGAQPTAQAALGAAATVGAIRQGLLDAIDRLRTAMAELSQHAQSVGNGLEANARGVVTDIDQRLGDKLEYTFDRLDSTERQLMEDAQELVGQIDGAARDVVGKTAAEARQLLGDADILAYNTMYSLPCRSQQPRVVYVTPEEIYEGVSLSELRIRGNYLAFGDEPTITVDGVEAKLLSRGDNEIRLRLPGKLLRGVEEPHSVSVRFRPTAKSRTCYLFGLVPWSSLKKADQDILASVVLQPRTVLKVEATITPITLQRATQSFPFHFEQGDDDCGAAYDVDRTWCLPSGWKLVSSGPYSGPHENSANRNCSSGVNGARLAGDNCVHVEARVQGCGYRDFWLGRECKGRGWVNYDITLHGERNDIETAGVAAVAAAEAPAAVSTNFVLRYSGDLAGQAVKAWKYEARLDLLRGPAGQVVKSVSLTDVDPVVGGIASRIAEGVLTIDAAQLLRTIQSGP